MPLFAPLPERGIERLARCAERVTVAAGEEVFHAGDSGDRFFVIESGEAQVIITDELSTDLGPGGSFGEIALTCHLEPSEDPRAYGDYAAEFPVPTHDDILAAHQTSTPSRREKQ